jgi:type I restriction enzyme S subunit
MANELRFTPLGELCDLERGITYGIVKVGEFVPGGVPVIRGGDIRNGRIVFDDEKRVTEEISRQFGRTILRGGEIVINLIAEPGHTAIVPPELAGANVSRDVGVISLNETVDHRYVDFCLKSRTAVQWLTSRLQGSVTQKINLGILRDLPVPTPALKEQRAIAYILGTLDDKIELNRHMNETAEAMTRALFKSWFVDFDPVRAKAEGRAPDLPKPVVDLFPDSFGDSELGEIPTGWEVQRFADTIDIIGGGTPKTSVAEYWDGDIPWFSVVDAPIDSDVWVADTARKITRKGVENSSTRILPVGTTIISARGTVGRIALVAVPMAMNQSCYGLRGKARARGFFTYYATRELVTRLQQHAHGSVFDTITQDTLAGVSLASPPAALIEAFETRVGPALERIRANLLSSRTLAALRDTLLPKLISGEMRVKNAERLLEETTE